MHDELTARQRAIRLRLAGRSVNYIRSALDRVKAWFHKWWGRYLQAGPEGLYDLTPRPSAPNSRPWRSARSPANAPSSASWNAMA